MSLSCDFSSFSSLSRIRVSDVDECIQCHLSKQGVGDLRILSLSSLKRISPREKKSFVSILAGVCLLGEPASALGTGAWVQAFTTRLCSHT